MKNLKWSLSTVLIIFLFLMSCGGNSIENDAKKAAKLACEAQELMQQAMSGDMSALSKSESLLNKAEDFYDKMEGKYSSGKDLERFADAYMKALSKCN